MARKPRGTGAKEQELELLTALRFVKVAQNEGGKADYQQHCRFTNGYVIAFNGILTAGYPIAEEMSGCPHTFRFIDALSRVRGAYTLTLLDNKRLSISSGAYRAVVPCIDTALVDPIPADPMMYGLTDKWKQAAVRAGIFCTDGAQTVLGASVSTYGTSMVGSNGIAIIEAWHGSPMPNELIIPMAFVQAVAKVEAPIVGFGYNGVESLTIHFEGGAWLRTQLYQEAYPIATINRVLSALDMKTLTAVPEGFFDAIDAVVPFSATSSVYIEQDQVRSNVDTAIGAQHQCPGLPYPLICINGANLAKLKTFVSALDFATYQDKVIVAGDNSRAVLIRLAP